jgi:hypothetical protein
MLKINRRAVWLILTILIMTLLSGCGQILAQPTPTPTPTNTPEPPTPTPIPPTNTPEPTATETPVPSPTDTLPPPPTPTQVLPTSTPYGQKPIYIYFIQKNTGGNVGCGDSLVPVHTNVSTTDDMIVNVKLALQQLFFYHVEMFGNLYNPLYLSSISVSSVDYAASGQVDVELSGTFGKTGDACDGSRIFAMLQGTIRQFPEFRGNPSITLNGVGIKNWLYTK